MWQYIRNDKQAHDVGDAILIVRDSPNGQPRNYSLGSHIILQKGFIYEWKQGQPSETQLQMDGFIKFGLKEKPEKEQ